MKLENKTSGKIVLRLIINSTDGGEIYNKMKNLIVGKDEIDIKVKFEWLKPGEYDLMIDTTDLISGKSAFEYKKIRVK